MQTNEIGHYLKWLTSIEILYIYRQIYQILSNVMGSYRNLNILIRQSVY